MRVIMPDQYTAIESRLARVQVETPFGPMDGQRTRIEITVSGKRQVFDMIDSSEAIDIETGEICEIRLH